MKAQNNKQDQKKASQRRSMVRAMGEEAEGKKKKTEEKAGLQAIVQHAIEVAAGDAGGSGKPGGNGANKLKTIVDQVKEIKKGPPALGGGSSDNPGRSAGDMPLNGKAGAGLGTVKNTNLQPEDLKADPSEEKHKVKDLIKGISNLPGKNANSLLANELPGTDLRPDKKHGSLFGNKKKDENPDDILIKANRHIVEVFIDECEKTVKRLKKAGAGKEHLDSINNLVTLYKGEFRNKESGFDWKSEDVLSKFKNWVVTDDEQDLVIKDLFYLRENYPMEQRNIDRLANWDDSIKPLPVRPIQLIPISTSLPELKPLQPIAYYPSIEMRDKWANMTAEQIVKDNDWDWEEVKKLFLVYPGDSSGTKAGTYAYIKQRIMSGWTPKDGTPKVRHWMGEDGITVIQAWKFDQVRRYARNDLGIQPDTGVNFRWYKSYYSIEKNEQDKRNLYTVTDKPLAHEADFKKAKEFHIPFKGGFWDFHDQYGTFDNYIQKVVYADRQTNIKNFTPFDPDNDPNTIQIGIVKNRYEGDIRHGVRLRESPYTEQDKGYVESEKNKMRWLAFNEKVFIKAYSKEHGWYLVETVDGEIGYAGSDYIETNLPEPGAKYYVVEKGDTLFGLALHFYPDEKNQMNFVNEIVNMNKGAGVYKDGEPNTKEARDERNAFIKANDGVKREDWSKFKVKYDFLIWIPSKEYAKSQIINKTPDKRYGGASYTPRMIELFVQDVETLGYTMATQRDAFYATDDERDEITSEIKTDWELERDNSGYYTNEYGNKITFNYKSERYKYYPFWSGEFVDAGWGSFLSKRRMEIEAAEKEKYDKAVVEQLYRKEKNPEKDYTQQDIVTQSLKNIKQEMMASWFSAAENNAIPLHDKLSEAYSQGVGALIKEGKITYQQLMGSDAPDADWKSLIKGLSDQSYYKKILSYEHQVKNITGSTELLYHPLTGKSMEKSTKDPEYDKFMLKLKAKQNELGGKNYKDNIQDMLIGAYLRYLKANEDMDRKITSYHHDVWGHEIGEPVVIIPRNTILPYTPGKDQAERIRDIYYDAKAEVMVLAKAYFLNMDPGQLSRTGFWGSLWEGFTEASFWSEWETNTDFIQQFAQACGDHNVPLSDTQKDRLKLLFSEKAGHIIGAMIPEAFKIVVASLVTEGLGAIPAIARAGAVLRTACVIRFGKYGEYMYGALAGGISELATFTIAGQDPWNGLGEGIAEGLFNVISPVKFRGWAKYAKMYTSRVVGGALSQTVAEYAGDFVSNLMSSGFDFKQAFKDTFGRNFEEASDKLLLTIFVSSLFSTASNAKLFWNLKAELEQNNNVSSTDKATAIKLLNLSISIAGEGSETNILEETKAMSASLLGSIEQYKQSRLSYGETEVNLIEKELLALNTYININPEASLLKVNELNQRFEPYRKFNQEFVELMNIKENDMSEEGLQSLYNDIASLQQQLAEHKSRKLSTYGFKMAGGIAASVILPIPPHLVNFVFKVGAKVYHLVSIKSKITYKKWHARMKAENLGLDFDDPQVRQLLKECFDSYQRNDVTVDGNGNITFNTQESAVLANEQNSVQLEFAVGSFKDVSKQSYKDKKTPDHIPSFAAIKKWYEQKYNGGKALTETQANDLRNRTGTINYETVLHQQYSRTYGWRNTSTQIANDALDLEQAALRDMEVIRPHLMEQGYSPEAIDAAFEQIHTFNRNFGLY